MRSIYSPEPAAGWIPWGLLAPVLCLVFVVAPVAGLMHPLADLGIFDRNYEPVGLRGLAAQLVLEFAASGLLVLLWVMLVEQRPLSTIGLSLDRAPSFLSGHVIGMVTVAGVVVAIWIFGGYHRAGIAPALGDSNALAGIGLLLLAFVVQSSVEEVLFRGWLLSAITRKLGFIVAVVLSGALFTLLHYAPGQLPLVTANVFLFAVFASLWAWRVGSIWGVMGWHAGWNWLLAVGFQVPVTGINVGLPALVVTLMPQGPAHLTGGAQGPEGSIFCTIFFVTASLGLLASRPK